MNIWRVAAAAAMSVLVAVPASASAPERYDWIEVVATARTDTNVGLRLWVNGRGVGPSAPVFGHAASVAGYAVSGAHRVGGAEVRTTRDLGGADVEVATRGGTAGVVSLYASSIQAGQQASLLVFLPEGRIDHTQLEQHGELDIEVRTGVGSEVMLATDAAADGLGASAGGVAVASDVTATRTVSTGVVGALLWCETCETAWAGPDGRSGGKTVFGHEPAPTLFSGPAGSWSWQWSGVQVDPRGEQALAAFAPIGDGWLRYSKPWHERPRGA